MTIYSYSRLTVYEQCPLKFKFRYIDKLIPEFEKTLESHLGSIVHQTLEWFYIQIKEKNITPDIEQMMMYYSKKWEENFTEEIKNVKKELTEKDYFNKGIKFLVDYYLKNKPFKDNTLEVEKRVTINLGENGKHKLQGFIDRLSYNPETDEFEIHDYKTANNLPQKKKIKGDKQLALYSIAVKELFGKDKKVCLTWHYLSHNLKVQVRKTEEEIEELKKEIIRLIRKIEEEKEFPYKKSALCQWCGYKKICPAWKPETRELEKFPTIRKYIKD
ncbi:MAG: PD-(D/E)XK nuclease family protein [Nanoarchaeota archaeon]|nr:PD-(D/E)XK nuclease family protein [Nanoarchaeota archaeon]